jgi:hypothetical protein
MGGVVAAVPGVKGGHFFQGLAAVFGMVVAALPLVFGERAEEEHPAVVQGIEKTERELGGRRASVVEFGPELFIVAFDDGPVLGEGETRTDVSIHVAVGNVMDELADGPAAFAIRGVELDGAEAFDGGAEVLRERGEGGQVRGVVGGIGFGAAEFADGVARVGGGGGGLRCGAHTPQGTPRVTAGTRQASARWKLWMSAVRRSLDWLRRGGGSACRCGSCDDDGDGDAKTQKRKP